MKSLLAKIWKVLHLPKNIQILIMRIFQDQFLIGTTGIIFNEKNQILLFNHTYRQHSWSLPGGYVKSGEHPGEGLEREIKEESNLTVNADEQFKLRTDRDTGRIDVTYIGTFISGQFQKSHEVSQAGFFSFDRLPLLSKTQLLLINEALDIKKRQAEARQAMASSSNESDDIFTRLARLFKKA